MKTSLDILDNHKWVNAAGTAGFAPTAHLTNKFPELGLFTTNPISYLPRSPAKERCMITYGRDFLVHNGFPCPGFKSVIKKYRKVWETSNLPICINLLSDHPGIIEEIIRSVENIDNIAVVEVMIDQNCTVVEIVDILKAAAGELPIILSVPNELVYSSWFNDLDLSEVAAWSLQPLRGTRIQKDKIISGRLYGLSMLPLTLRAITHLSNVGKPIIAGVGALTPGDVQDIYQVGANNFQPNELLWRDYS